MEDNIAVLPELPPPIKYILGLDMATHTSGVAILDTNGKLIDSRCIYGSGDSARERIKSIYVQLIEYINNYNILVGVVEDILLNKFVPNLNACRDLCILQGAVLSCLWSKNIDWEVYTANHWKSVVGIFNGPEGKTRAAQKTRSIQLVKNKYNIEVDDNQSDAICIALSYLINNNYITQI